MRRKRPIGGRIKSVPKVLPPLEAGVITHWQVSSVFSEAALNQKFLFPTGDTKNLTWQTLQTEERGFVNVGKYVTRTDFTARSVIGIGCALI